MGKPKSQRPEPGDGQVEVLLRSLPGGGELGGFGFLHTRG